MHADLFDAVLLNPPYIHDQKIKRYPKEWSDMTDLEEEAERIRINTENLFKDRRFKDLQQIKNSRSKELFNFICDVVEEKGS